MGQIRSLLILLGLMVLVNSLLLTEIGLYSRNTPEHHPEWRLGKQLMQRMPFCTYDCLRTRNLTARNRLNLAAWHGFQEALINRVSDWERASFRYRLAPQAYVTVILSLTRDGYRGVRLGPDPAYLEADPGGRFLRQEKLTLPTGAGWHRVELTRSTIAVDGGAPVAVPEVKGPGVFGFRGSYALAEVDDVKLWEKGQLVLSDSFRNDRHFAAAWVASLGVVLGATLLVWAVARGRRRPFHWLVLAHFTGFLGLGAYLFVDYAIWSVRYSENEPPEHARMAVFRYLDGADPTTELPLWPVEDFLNAHQPPRSEWRIQVYNGQTYVLKETPEAVQAWRQAHHPRRTILFLGCSQNWGEGVRYLDDAMIPQARTRLVPALGADLEVLNCSRQGTNSSELVKRYLECLYLFEPDLVVAYLGSTDNDAGLLGANLHRLMTWNRRRGIATLIVKEANSPENPPSNPPHLAEKHKAMQAAADAQKVPAVDLNAWLGDPARAGTGFLWWDPVHMTSQGHKLSGQFLAESILRVMGRESGPRG